MAQQKIKNRNKLINVSIRFSTEEIFVGKLILENRQVYFKYDDSFLELDLNLSPFRLKYTNEIQLAPLEPFHGIFGVFDDSLPDGWGMLLLNRALEKRGLSLNDINILDQLSYIGDSGKGALIYRPAYPMGKSFNDQIDIDQLRLQINKVYLGSSADFIEKLISLGGSSGGSRPKANIGFNPKTKKIIHGQNTLPKGFKHWIVKFPGMEDPKDIANIEYAYYKLALKANIKMSQCQLFESKKGIQVFVTKRFYRMGNNRIHMHSMAGLTHDNFRLSNIDYGHIIDIAYRLEKTAKAREKVFRLAAFNIYSHNRDDHSKNFSWLMDHEGNWGLAPAYDLTYSSAGIDEHCTRVAGEGVNPGRINLLKLAREFSINKPNKIIDEVQEALSHWPTIAKQCGVTKNSVKRIEAKFLSLRD